jgi:plasmid stabilization system protein ParE
MKRFKILVSAPADAEIAVIYHYIREDSPANATKWRDGLLTAAEMLRMFPGRCALAPENGPFEFEIRQLLYGNYRVLFTIQAEAVVILHVRHGARMPLEPDEVISPEDT